jgi:hypothetical protein
MNNHPRMFTLYLIEDSDGQVRVVSDWSGDGDKCLSLGVEIMQDLAIMQPFTDNQLMLMPGVHSKLSH